MQTLFAKDMSKLDFSWLMERAGRCHEQIWQLSEQLISTNNNVVLDLGFTTKEQRDTFSKRVKALGIRAEIYYLDAPREVR